MGIPFLFLFGFRFLKHAQSGRVVDIPLRQCLRVCALFVFRISGKFPFGFLLNQKDFRRLSSTSQPHDSRPTPCALARSDRACDQTVLLLWGLNHQITANLVKSYPFVPSSIAGFPSVEIPRVPISPAQNASRVFFLMSSLRFRSSPFLITSIASDSIF